MSNKNKNILLGVLIVGIISMTVAFAALSTRLNINGTAKVSSFKWQIVIDDWTKVNNVSSLVSGSTNTAEEVKAGTPTADTTSVSGLEVAFKKTGDVVKYNFNIENKGTIDAELDSWHLNTTTDTDASKKVTCEKNGTSTECPNLTISVTCNNEAPVVGSALNVNDSIPCTYTVGYNEVNGTNGYNIEEITIKNLGMSFTYKEKASGGSTPVVQNDYICKRATTLDTKTCTQEEMYGSYYGCATDGDVGNGNAITYGSIGTGSTLTAGEALDCKVSTSGDYTERFYYITDLESNSDYAVLLYSKDTSSGTVAYDSSNENWHGPQTAVSSLPTTSTWDNISLSSTSRQLYAWDGTEGSTLVTTTNNGSNSLGMFDYSGYAGRLLTYSELKAACPNAQAYNGVAGAGSLSSCSYLMENTKYSSSSKSSYGYWLETPRASHSSSVWSVNGLDRGLRNDFAVSSGDYGARPAIEVLKSKIQLN